MLNLWNPRKLIIAEERVVCNGVKIIRTHATFERVFIRVLNIIDIYNSECFRSRGFNSHRNEITLDGNSSVEFSSVCA